MTVSGGIMPINVALPTEQISNLEGRVLCQTKYVKFLCFFHKVLYAKQRLKIQEHLLA